MGTVPPGTASARDTGSATGAASVPRTGGRAGRIVAGSILGTIPGLLVLAASLVASTGEAQLSVGAIAVLITACGAVVGGILGAHRDLGPGPMALGALLGAIPGAGAFLWLTRLAPVILVVGSLAGGLVIGRAFSPHDGSGRRP